MRYVKKDLAEVPPSLKSQKALDDIEKIAAAGDTSLISDKIYKGAYKDKEGKSQSLVREYLNRYYKKKCAYCEDFCKAEIEHYRPKKAVAGDKTHKGYYWLCYTWSNLIPSCRYCNTEGGKGNKFPIINKPKRVKNPSFKLQDQLQKLNTDECDAHVIPLIDEEPFLLHPELDKDPEDFLAFKISDDKVGVEIFGIDQKKRGEKTIEICNLNRTDLKIKRLQLYLEIKEKINIIFDLNANGRLPNEEVGAALGSVYKQIEKNAENDELPFTLLRKLVVKTAKNFEDYFSPYLEIDSVRTIAVQAFRNYKSQN